ncbi:hypothetical protein RKD18_000459 [Streptomyces phaeoluteigriseus]
MTNDVDTLAAALYATTDDILKEHPEPVPWRPPVGITFRLSDAELVTLATMQAIGRGSERELAEQEAQLLLAARKGERERPGAALFKPLRQAVESIKEIFE